jgi:opacity protein-like surface antigen
MLKKWGFVFLLIFSPSVFAGVYLGLSANYDNIFRDDASYQGVGPQVAIGYSGVTNQWLYLAGELFGSTRGWQINNNIANGQSMKPIYSLGASLIPGYILDMQVMAYLRAGTIYTRFDQGNAFRNAYQIGAGLQYNLSCAWDIRAEYDYMQYNKIQGGGSPRTEEFSVGVIYRIN